METKKSVTVVLSIVRNDGAPVHYSVNIVKVLASCHFIFLGFTKSFVKSKAPMLLASLYASPSSRGCREYATECISHILSYPCAKSFKCISTSAAFELCKGVGVGTLSGGFRLMMLLPFHYVHRIFHVHCVALSLHSTNFIVAPAIRFTTVFLATCSHRAHYIICVHRATLSFHSTDCLTEIMKHLPSQIKTLKWTIENISIIREI
ncbi:hypothetical protein Fmac_007909 [Flemingia macrophylla]|uniref:Uncharacterized protein n=1 Tax=Flemingia macrophylla TaxID=520843 RepID=A0ABD1MW03_9FABA